MTKLLIAFVLGIVVGKVGFSGVARILDNGVEKTKAIAVEGAK
jgi:hypothetical protein